MIDILIIGAGGAGLTAALEAKKSGLTVKVVSKSYPTRAQTTMAQGGINAALSHAGEDSVELHMADTIRSSKNLGSESLIKKMCQEAPDAIRWLDRLGVAFSRNDKGEVAQRKLGGASASRACYAQDYTGLKILHTLYDQALHCGIEFLNEQFLMDFIIEDESVKGAVFLDIKTSQLHEIHAKSVIVATGGYSKVFHDFSTNSVASTGDGIAASLRAGCRISDIEFMQFHPTALANSAILISESARGIGGHLVNAEGSRFTDELASRDVVARAIFEEIERSGSVYLDLRHIDSEVIEASLPQEKKLAALYEGIDLANELVPIKPVAHYSMGGIDVDENGMSSIQGLFAIGECANQRIHGANRLGGNALLELIVFGKVAAKAAVEYTQKHVLEAPLSSILEIRSKDIERSLCAENISVDFYQQFAEMGRSNYHYLGLFRDEAGLKEVANRIAMIENQLDRMGPSDSSRTYNTNLIEFLEFKNLLQISQVMVESARLRKESRGAHYRTDYRESEIQYEKHTICRQSREGIEYEFGI